MNRRPGRWLPDAMRTSYTKHATVLDGTEVVVRAMRKEDVDVVGEVMWWMPAPAYLAAQVVHELRTRGKYEGRWTVEEGRRWGSQRNVKLGEFSKSDALNLVDKRAAEITRGSPPRT